jgi:LEA14-like dessication related protein
MIRPRTLAICLPLLAGCGLSALARGHFEPPVVVLNVSRIESISPKSVAVHLVLGVQNPNEFGLSARVVGWRLRVNGQTLAAGRSSNRVTVAARATAVVDVRMDVPFPALSAAAPDALMLGEIPYDLDGTLSVGSLFSSREVPFATSGVLDISPPLTIARLGRLPSRPGTGTPAGVNHP